MAMKAEFWQGKKVLITGHTGFKGSWLSLWLQSLGAELVGYALSPPTVPNLFEVAQVADNMISIVGDICHLEHLQNVIAEHKPQIIFHLAAQPLVRYSYLNPVETYATNVMGTVHLFEAVRRVGGIKVIVNVTSDKCYANREWVWGYREDEPMGGCDPYSSSKGCAELVTAAFRYSFFNRADFNTHGTAIASVRAGNVIGGGDWAVDRLIPDMIRAVMANQPIVIRNPDAIRPWQYVLEPLNGYLLLAQKLWEQGTDYAEAWNFGPNDEDAKPVSWLIEQLIQLWGQNLLWQVDERHHPYEAHYLKLDCSKAKNQLGWKPCLNLRSALILVGEWYKAYLTGEDMAMITRQQIKQFSNNLNQGHWPMKWKNQAA
jgi:CDP-glucose 4,6-dehydratase